MTNADNAHRHGRGMSFPQIVLGIMAGVFTALLCLDYPSANSGLLLESQHCCTLCVEWPAS